MKKLTASIIINIVLLSIICILITQQVTFIPKTVEDVNSNSVDVGAKPIEFTPSELETWLSIKDRIQVINTDPNFADPNPEHRILGWYSMRNSSSNDYYQKSMEFLLFWEGQGTNGEWEAVISIYNVPNRTDDFVIEFSRFTWNSIKITLDGVPMAEFDTIKNDTTSLAYTTFHVTP